MIVATVFLRTNIVYEIAFRRRAVISVFAKAVFVDIALVRTKTNVREFVVILRQRKLQPDTRDTLYVRRNFILQLNLQAALDLFVGDGVIDGRVVAV